MTRERSKIVLVLGLVALLLVTPELAQARPVPGVVTQTVLDDRDFARMERGGVETLFASIRWREVEPEPGRLDWSSTDHVLASAARHGIEVLPIVYGSPAWVAQSELHPPIDDAADRASWRSFLTALVGRYGPRGDFWTGSERRAPITRWQIWNEPNFDFYWDPKPAVGEYARLLEIFRRSDPVRRSRRKDHARRRRGGTERMPWWRFLRRLYEQPGVKRDFDFVALHPYAPGLRLMRRQIELARRIMATADDSRTPLAITEVGWASEGRRRRWSRAPRAGTAAQAHLPPARRRPSGLADLGRAVVRLARFDGGRGVPQLLPARGPFDLAGQPKPAWRAYQQAVRGRWRDTRMTPERALPQRPAPRAIACATRA